MAAARHGKPAGRLLSLRRNCGIMGFEGCRSVSVKCASAGPAFEGKESK